jgi:hypothetical protein
MQSTNNFTINSFLHPFQYIDNKVEEIKKADFSSNPMEAESLSHKYMGAMIVTGLVAVVALLVAIAVLSPFIALAIGVKVAIIGSGLILAVIFATISAQMGKVFFAYGSHDPEKKRLAAERAGRLFGMTDILGTQASYNLWLKDKNTTLFNPATIDEFTKFEEMRKTYTSKGSAEICYRSDVRLRGLLSKD